MYVFEDRDGQLMALRPEGTAPDRPGLRPAPPACRPGRPGTWRRRSATSTPSTAATASTTSWASRRSGPADADLDVEVVALAHDFFAGLGLRQVDAASCNSMGDGVCQPGYVALLGAFLAERADQLCPAHRARHLENPLRVLDCKTPGVPGRHRGRAALPRPPLRPVRGALRPGARRARRARASPTRSTTAWSGASTTTPAPRSSSPPRRSTRPRTASAAAAATTAWSSCWAATRRRASGSASGSSGCCSPATPRASSRTDVRGGGAPAARLRDRHRRRGVRRRASRPSCAGPACGPTGPSTGAP